VGDLTEHFSKDEFRDHQDGTLIGPSKRLLWLLEALRAEVGHPIVIVRGYVRKSHQRALYTRLRAQDRAAGRRPRPYVSGYHPQGRAVDVHRGVVTVDQAVAVGFRGIGRSGEWAVHLDDRSAPSPVIFEDRADG